MGQHDLLDAFLRRLPALRALAPAMRAQLQGELTRGGVPVHALSERVKSLPSLAGKLAHPGRTYRHLDDITDLVGLRVITYFDDGIEAAAHCVERAFRIDAARSVDKRRQDDPSHFGYQSLHYICRPPADLVAAEPAWDVAFEVQIRTILQHAWAEIEHDLGYKSPEALPLPVRRRFSRLAGLLEIADHEFVALRRTMEDYTQSLRRPDSLGDTSIGLDAASFRPLVATPAVTALDDALVRHLGCPRGDGLFFPEYVLQALRAVGLDGPRRVVDAAERLAPRFEDFAPRYFRFAAEALAFDPTRIERIEPGYGLLLLAHAHVLASHPLDLHRVAQLRALYVALDHLDEAHAWRVAETFVRVCAAP